MKYIKNIPSFYILFYIFSHFIIFLLEYNTKIE